MKALLLFLALFGASLAAIEDLAWDLADRGFRVCLNVGIRRDVCETFREAVEDVTDKRANDYISQLGQKLSTVLKTVNQPAQLARCDQILRETAEWLQTEILPKRQPRHEIFLKTVADHYQEASNQWFLEVITTNMPERKKEAANSKKDGDQSPLPPADAPVSAPGSFEKTGAEEPQNPGEDL